MPVLDAVAFPPGTKVQHGHTTYRGSPIRAGGSCPGSWADCQVTPSQQMCLEKAEFGNLSAHS